MAPLNLTIMIIFLSFSSTLASHKSKTKSSMTYIESACQTTRYPDLCIRSLSIFGRHATINGPQNLAHIALSVSLTRALQTRGYLLKVVKELEELNNTEIVYLTVQDCEKQITDSIDQLSQAIKELRRLNKFTIIDDNMLWHISNVETWVSTALTDASYCVQSFPGHRMSKRTATVKSKVQNVAEVTSNGLALFHSYAAKYKVAAAAAKAAKSIKKP